MSERERISERMPDVAAGGAWSPEEAALLASDPDLAAEWALVQAARRVGDRAAASIDGARVAAAVLARLRAEPSAPVVLPLRRRRLVSYVAPFLAAAAVVMIAVWTGRPRTSAAPAATVLVPLPELDELSSDELRSVLRSLEERVASPDGEATEGLESPSAAELEAALETLEG